MSAGNEQRDTTLHVLRRGDFAAEHLAGPRRLYVSANLARAWRVIRGWPGPVQAWGDAATRMACFAKPSKVVGVAPPGGPDVLLPVRWLECHTTRAAARAKDLGYAPGAIRVERPTLPVPTPTAEERADDEVLRVLVAPTPSWEDGLRSAVLAAAVLCVTGRPTVLISSGVGPMSLVLARLAGQLEQPGLWITTDRPFVECVNLCDVYLHVARRPTDPLPWRTARAAGLPTLDGSRMKQRHLAQKLKHLWTDLRSGHALGDHG